MDRIDRMTRWVLPIRFILFILHIPVPAQPDTVLAGMSRGFRGGDAALFHSTDRGETWAWVTEERPSLADTIFKALAVSRSSSGVAAAGTMAGEVWLSEDGGATWRVAASGLPPVRSLLLE
jgi:photosystem II stability/assembly factor-like uncharacterized protein